MASCPVCGCEDFKQSRILWPELIAEWELAPDEVEYIDEQQGFACQGCGSSLRAMTLAGAILTAFGSDGRLVDWVDGLTMPVLEINEAQRLTPFLGRIQGHVLARYPDVDMHALPYSDSSFRLVVHSDTLEHVQDPVQALRECRRVLKPGGCLAYTVPVVVGRLSRSRAGLPLSYHGASGDNASDLVVHTEFGSDVWSYAMRAGFGRVELFTYRYPASVAIVARNLD